MVRAGMAVAAVVVGIALCGCKGQPAASGSPASPGTPAVTATQHHAPAAHHRKHSHHRRPTRAGQPPLHVVHDPGQVTGTLTGPCHTRDNGQLPDPSCTPGGIDPAVTQANIQSTICRSGYTGTIRPPEAQTEAFKWNIAEPAYGQNNVSGELDHLVPLELGGANDASNLWVEAGPIPNRKDDVEYALNQAVCAGRVSLRAAQRAIARDWLTAEATLGIGGQSGGSGGGGGGGTSGGSGGSGGWCTASASYSSSYGDWDVSVRSNQPGATVTASGGGYSHSWHTDSGGSADVYLRGPSQGQTIDVTAGSAHCSTTAG